MKPEEFANSYLQQARTMQVASVKDNRPWVCTVYFVADAWNVFWLSLPSRRHSQEIKANPHIAAAIPIKLDTPVVGLQIAGRAEVVTEASLVLDVMKQYGNKYNVGQEFYANFIAGKNQHWLYRLRPSEMVLFDEMHFASDPRKVISLQREE